MTLEVGLLTALGTLAGVVSKMYLDMRNLNKEIKTMLDNCIKERQELLSHIISSNTHREFKEKVAESLSQELNEKISAEYKALK